MNLTLRSLTNRLRKSITVGLCISFFVITACSLSTESGTHDIPKEDVLGSWKITNTSNKEKQNSEDAYIKGFELISDSTATVSFGGSRTGTLAGSWVWDAKKELGNEQFGIVIKSDVVIHVKGLYTLGLQIKETDGKIFLSAGEYSFEKISN